ncbi:MAG TPA: asparagine synthase-related protein, partial [Candidatus Hydrogenedentes bacterium]|nr:asparagine synthase-related protein [Candidatus Hydrogenedentota bacterium]
VGDLVPAAIARRPKRGFEPPRGEWLTGRLRAERDRLFSDAALARDGLFTPAAVHRMLDDHAAGRRDHTLALWALLVFQRWRNTENGGT